MGFKNSFIFGSVGLCCCWAFSSWGEQGLLSLEVYVLLSDCGGSSCFRAQALGTRALGLAA